MLHTAIVKYLGQVSREELSGAEIEYLHDYLNIATMFESIGDVVETDLIHAGEQRIKKNVKISRKTRETLLAMAEKVEWALQQATEAVNSDDPELARKVVSAKGDINAMAERIEGRLVQRLIAEDPHRTATYRVESQLIENYKRIYYFAKRIAKLVATADTRYNGERDPIAAA